MKNLTILLIAAALISLTSCDKRDSALYAVDNFSVSGDKYTELEENPFVNVADNPVSTFSIDADGASYANVRRFIMQENQKPPKGAVRTEELINYFNLDYPYTSSNYPIALNGEVSTCPWDNTHKLIRIGIKGQPVQREQLPASNFVFLIDVSGSMSSSDKLDLLKTGFKNLTGQLADRDRVAIVTYAGNAGVVLESTAGNEKDKIKSAIDKLGAGGSTAGGAGIKKAYEIAENNFVKGGNNRIVLGTDGDFNVGVSSQPELVSLIEEKRKSGVFLTVLGVGRGNLNDAAMEQIADHGNGTYEYIDNLEQMKKVFIYEYNKFFTVAKDVKVQVAFNPENVSAYRLIGYENRLLSKNDFQDDTKDAGEIGSNQNITALYEIIPTNNVAFKSAPTFTIDFRYKRPDSDVSVPLELKVFDEGADFNSSTYYMRFTSSVAAFSMLISDSKYKGSSNYDKVLEWTNAASLDDPYGFMSEFKRMVEKAKGM